MKGRPFRILLKALPSSPDYQGEFGPKNITGAEGANNAKGKVAKFQRIVGDAFYISLCKYSPRIGQTSENGSSGIKESKVNN